VVGGEFGIKFLVDFLGALLEIFETEKEDEDTADDFVG